MTGKLKNFHIYVVEDDPDELKRIKKTLTDEGFDVTSFLDALPVLRHVREHGLPHLAVIDLKLPSMHGFELSEKLQGLGDVPIIFISSQNESKTVIEGITRYADDYVVKSIDFDPLVLAARVQRVLSRIYNFSFAQAPLLKIDEHLSVDFGNSRLLLDERQVPLTPIETNLLHILLRNRGRVVSSETLIARVWKYQTVYEETLRVHMHRLRRKIEPDHRVPRYIQTERGMGYRFVE